MSNIPIDEVVAKYHNERLNKIYYQERQIEMLPGMKEIEARKKQILKSMLSDSIFNSGNIWQSEFGQISAEESKMRQQIQTGYTCNKCKDKGIINGKFCKCLRDLIYTQSYGAMDINSLKESFEASDHSIFQTGYKCVDGSQLDRYKRIEKYAKKYAEDFPANKKPNLFLTGNTGLGKSFVLRSIAKRLYQKEQDVLLIGASSLFKVFHAHRLGEEIDLDLLWDCNLLLIDDLGIEPITYNVTIEYFLDLLNRRIDNDKHTIIASNLTTDNIISRYGERVYSRIRFKEICDQLVFEGQDIRVL